MAHEDDKPHVRVSGDLLGLPVEASSNGRVGLDTEVLADRVEHGIERRVQYWIESCATQVLLAVFFGGLLVVVSAICAYAVYRQAIGDPLIAAPPAIAAPAGADAPVAGTWDGQSPFTCGGHANWTLTGVQATLPGQDAVVASGHCELTLVDVVIDAKIAVRAAGHAKVTVVGGSLTGSEAAVSAGGDAEVTLRGARVSGERAVGAAAHLIEE